MVRYALLDNCSQETFVSEELISSMNVPKLETELNVKAITLKLVIK